LPELFELLAKAVGRMVPRSDSEAALIQRVYRIIGPLPSKATETALGRIGRRLGTGRPMQIYLDALAASVTPRPKSPETKTKTRRTSP
jgi:hypothetical protein